MIIRPVILGMMFLWAGQHAPAQQGTYCNPLNIDYAYIAIPDFAEQGKHRATADPVITLFQGRYYLFSTNQYGYWWSDDLYDWQFVPRRFLKPYHLVYDELCAPAVLAKGDTLLVIGSTHTTDFPLWMSTNPTVDHWTEAVDSFRVGAWDPALFLDDDGRLYVYWGSSNFYPIYGQEINPVSFEPMGERVELIRLQEELHGWERFGEHADNTFLSPFMEGAWMNKYNGRYYLQYAAPGTEFSGYGDGVYIGEDPLGPFNYQSHNPFAYKPGGYARGAGHGATFSDRDGNWWHVGTMVIGVKNNFERRIGLWPAAFDEEGLLWCNTAFGDYPHYLPGNASGAEAGGFTGWMLLNYNKPVEASSTLGGYAPNFAVDEDIRTYWSAASGDPGEWFQTDLGTTSTVHAIQVNYADQDATLMGKQQGIFHRYVIYHSMNGRDWEILVDRSQNLKDVPHDYMELELPVETRYLKMQNLHVPTGKFALSGFRIFGKGQGEIPGKVGHFTVLRGDSERRNAWLKWQAADLATGYLISAGTAPDKLYNHIMVYGTTQYYFTAMERDRPCYFRIGAFNENGIGEMTDVVRVE